MDTAPARTSDDDDDGAVSGIPRLSYPGTDDRVSLPPADRARGVRVVVA